MGTIKNAVYKVDNGTDFDEIHFKTKASQVFCNDGKTVESQLAEIMNEANLNAGWFKDKKTGLILQWGRGSFTATSAVKDLIITLPTSFLDGGKFADVNLYSINQTWLTNGFINTYPDATNRIRSVIYGLTNGIVYNYFYFALGY